MKNNKSFMEKINSISMKISEPLGCFARKPAIASIQDGLVASMPIILVGSVFIILYTLATPSIGGSGEALLPFLAPYANAFSTFHALAINSMALYCSISISIAYAKKKHIDATTAALLGLASFLLINIAEVNENMISVASFGAAGLITSILTSLLSIFIYSMFIEKKFIIKMPDAVPPNIQNAFSSLVPYFVILTMFWIVRSILNFDLTTWLGTILAPLFNGADNVFLFSAHGTLHGLFWSVGLHFDNLVSPVLTPLRTVWQQGNIDAFLANIDMPYIYTEALERMTITPGIFWAPLFLMMMSKLKHIRTLGWASFPAMIFTISEPVVFGLMVFNPFMIIPLTLSGLVTSFISYQAVALGFVSQSHLFIPWATPAFINGPLSTGDWRSLILILVIFIISLAIYYPFFKAYERNELAKEASKRLEEKVIEND